ncbi:SDR family oxidoreductase [Nocardiopsis sp. HNM0947]|uniref:SDR family oxidoreductase n=1 Tax=Nocardiopsis coralli TaxID=2772213 RepID=A0ABR9PA56_9ACTN|nr:SDR family oxidoreductase [Nocardiopsis coralli]MBE3000709.1 SDR family oxidoreductase [Nocardiopsis coralli]
MSWPKGQAAFVTGAASGLGLGIARALVAAGAKVALVDIDEERVNAAADELRAKGGTVTTVVFDISDPALWKQAADQAEEALGPISILCNNAGVSGTAAFENTPYETWRWVHSINLDAQYLGVDTFLPRFKKHGGRAHIMSTSSMAGIVPMKNTSAYTSSKFASIGFNMVLREELDETEIGVSVLCPGTVATRIVQNDGALQKKMLGREVDAESIVRNAAQLAGGAGPDKVGEQVVEAMRNDQFWIVTHREWLPVVQQVHAETEQAFTEFDGRHGEDPTAVAMLDGGFSVAGK